MALRPGYRLALLGVVAIAIWIVAQDYTWKAAADLDAESDRLAGILDEASTRGIAVDGSAEVREAIRTFGRVRIPRDDRSGTEALQTSVDRVMKDTKVNYTLETHSSGKFPAGAFPGIARPGERVEKVVGDMRFDASQAETIKIIERLEASEDIESVSNVKLTKKADNKLASQLTVVAWVRVPDSRQR